MQLTQPEIIQILRRRRGLNQAQLGAKAFDANLDSGRTKIKNIELGRQLPTKDDLNKLALALGIGIAELVPGDEIGALGNAPEGVSQLTPDALDLFPGIGEYFDLLNKAVQIDDHELIGYISAKISEIFASVYRKRAAGS